MVASQSVSKTCKVGACMGMASNLVDGIQTIRPKVSQGVVIISVSDRRQNSTAVILATISIFSTRFRMSAAGKRKGRGLAIVPAEKRQHPRGTDEDVAPFWFYSASTLTRTTRCFRDKYCTCRWSMENVSYHPGAYWYSHSAHLHKCNLTQVV